MSMSKAEKDSIWRAKEFLIFQGILSRDGSGHKDVEAVFSRLSIQEKKIDELLSTLSSMYEPKRVNSSHFSR